MSISYKYLVDRFEEAVRDHAWKGAKHPLAQADIEQEYQESKQALMDALRVKRSTRVEKGTT